jgi:hypothetical protein
LFIFLFRYARPKNRPETHDSAQLDAQNTQRSQEMWGSACRKWGYLKTAASSGTARKAAPQIGFERQKSQQKDCKGLYVSQKSPTSFDRKGFESIRMDRLDRQNPAGSGQALAGPEARPLVAPQRDRRIHARRPA